MKNTFLIASLATLILGSAYFADNSKTVSYKNDSGTWVKVIDIDGNGFADITLTRCAYSGNFGGLYSKSVPSAIEQEYFAEH